MPPGFVEIVFEIRFHHGDLVTTPLNLGPLPLLVLDLADVGNLLRAEVSVLQPGTAPEGFDFPEQKISINATAEEMSALTGEFALEFGGAASRMMPINASAAAMTAALMALETVGSLVITPSILTDWRSTRWARSRSAQYGTSLYLL